MIKVKQTIFLGTYYTIEDMIRLLLKLEDDNAITIHKIIDVDKLSELLNG